MKRVSILLIGFALCTTMAVGYSDSHVIKKDLIQADNETSSFLGVTINHISAAEVPFSLVVEAPYLGRPASNYIEVSEKLADMIVIRIRPPPEKVQKSVT